MNYAKVNAPKDIKVKKKLYIEALLNSFEYWTDELDCSKKWSRQRIDKSFSKVLETCLEDRSTHWSILLRDKTVADDIVHYEFGANSSESPSVFLWIRVNVELAEEIFKKYKLSIIKY